MVDEVSALLGASHLGPGQIALRLGAAIALSCLIGLDREIKKKPLGLRTNMLVGLGSASFCLIVVELMHSYDPGPHASPIDAGRIIEGIIGGIGFLGAGAIIQERDRIIGATTGAGIWATAASTSSAPATCTLQMTSPVAGFMVSKLRPERASW